MNIRFGFLIAQVEIAPGKYRIDFINKSNSPYSTDNPELFLSQRAIERRQRQEIPVDFYDLPVNPQYIDSVRSSGARILTVSKWLNSITIQVDDSSVLEKVMRFSFVKPAALKPVKTRDIGTNKTSMSMLQEQSSSDYGCSECQIAMLNGIKLHDYGYTGEGMHIAVIDAGFAGVDTMRAFLRLWENHKILGHRDFVNPNSNIFREHTHGKTVLSILGGFIPGYLKGSAPDAAYWLLRSEDGTSEYPIEEDNWAAAAEFADSAGADVINTSLGYSVFNDSTQNHTYENMDGNTTRVAIAADIAVSRGMLVVASAGNEGGSPWHYIQSPADADSVLAVGAVDSTGTIAYFSSSGPAADGRVKPDVCAMGVRTCVQGIYGIAKTNGTSASAPIISGLAACLWQANPQAKVMEIRNAIVKSADRYQNPDSLYGYGIPDFNLANIALKLPASQPEPDAHVFAFPNPSDNQIYLWFNDLPVSEVTCQIYDLSGRLLKSNSVSLMQNERYLVLDKELQNLRTGLYLLHITTRDWHSTLSLFKL